MASTDRSDTRAVAILEELSRAPDRFSFFQALRRIESAFADRARLGQGQHPVNEPLRIVQETSMAFSPSVIRSLEQGGEGPPRLVTNFLGLLGPNGPLPLHLTEFARDRVRNSGDSTFVHFLDMFHHRILSLYYRAYANSQPAFDQDRPSTARFARYVGSLFGFGMASSDGRDAIPDTFRLFFAGRLGARPRNAEGLAAMVGAYLGITARIEEFVGEWVDIPKPSRLRLGGPGIGSQIGRGAALGKRAWMLQGRFLLELGPLDADQASRLMPGGAGLPDLAALVWMYVGDTMTWDLRLVLHETACGPCQLGRGTHLGPTCWLGNRPRTVMVRPPAYTSDKKQRPRPETHAPTGRTPDPVAPTPL